MVRVSFTTGAVRSAILATAAGLLVNRLINDKNHVLYRLMFHYRVTKLQPSKTKAQAPTSSTQN